MTTKPRKWSEAGRLDGPEGSNPFELFENIALRSTESGLSLGSGMPNSRRWEDGEPTDEELPGASGVKVKSEADVERYLETIGKYPGTTVYLIGGDAGEWGEDPGEFIIYRPKILRVYAAKAA